MTILKYWFLVPTLAQIVIYILIFFIISGAGCLINKLISKPLMSTRYWGYLGIFLCLIWAVFTVWSEFSVLLSAEMSRENQSVAEQKRAYFYTKIIFSYVFSFLVCFFLSKKIKYLKGGAENS